MSLCTIFCFGALWARQDAAPEDALALLRGRLEARDAQIQNVFLVYEAKTVFESGVSVDKKHRESGWWYWEDGLQAAAALSENDKQGPRCEHVVWDGVKARRRWGSASWDDAEELLDGKFPNFARVEVSASMGAGLLGRGHSPGQFGSFVLSKRWSEYLDVFSNLKCVEQGMRNDRPVTILIGDMDGRKDDVEYTFPWRVTIDDETLLAVEIDYFTRKPGEGNLENKLSLDGVEWYRMGWRTTDKWEEFLPGIWLGTHGRAGMDQSGDTYTEVEVDIARSYLNRRPAEAFLASPIPAGTSVDDVTTGRRYSMGFENDPDRELNGIFLEQLRSIDAGQFESWQDFSMMSEPFSRTSFAGAAIYAFFLLNGERTALVDLLRQDAFKAISERPFEAEEIEGVRTSSGKVPRQVEVGSREPEVWRLCLSGGRLSVVRFSPEGALVFKPLSGLEREDPTNASFPPEDAVLWELTEGRRFSTRPLLMGGGVAALVCGCILAVVTSHRRRPQGAS